MSTRRKKKDKRSTALEDEQDEFDKKLAQLFSPIVWVRLDIGVRIEDLKPNYYEAALQMVKEHYVLEECLCRASEIIKDEESLNSYIARVQYQLNDGTSIAAINEETNELIGMLVLRVVNKLDYGRVFSRTQIVHGDIHKKIVAINTSLNRKVDLYDMYNCTTFLRYYALAVSPQYRKKGIGYNLMKCGIQVALSLKCPVVMGVFSSAVMQTHARKLGMTVLHEINYTDYRENGEMVFDDPGAGNYSIALMAGHTPKQIS